MIALFQGNPSLVERIENSCYPYTEFLKDNPGYFVVGVLAAFTMTGATAYIFYRTRS